MCSTPPALKEQFQRHCFIKFHQEETQPLLVPFVKDYYTSPKNIQWYCDKLLLKQKALPPVEVDRLIENRQAGLLKEASLSDLPIIDVVVQDRDEELLERPTQTKSQNSSKSQSKEAKPIWNRTGKK